MSVKLCVTVMADTMAELRERRDQVASADLVELRLDTVRDPSAEGALEGRRGPIIVTCRPAWEGGHFQGSEEERHRLLADAQRLGAEYIDVEWRAGFDDLVAARQGRGVVLSHHDFGGVPRDLMARAQAMRASGAEVVKLAVMARRLSDCLPLLDLRPYTTGPMVVLAMGEAGLPSRILAGRFGSSWTYAGHEAAPGQVPPARMVDEFAFDRVNDDTAVYGVVGRPVSHSASPAMHNAAFRAAGVNAVHLPLAADDYADFLRFADTLPLAGASVTAPFKVDAFRHAAVADELSRRVRAVNTLRFVDGVCHARNTDVDGFLQPLKALDPDGNRATILGAGGAARAVVEALQGNGLAVQVCARRRAQADELAALTGAAVVTWPPANGSWDLLVNATPVGTSPDVEASPLPDGPFTGRVVYDLVYNPPETRLLRDARAAGCLTIGGVEMLVAQAAQQFTWWTGQPAPVDALRQGALRALAVRGDATVHSGSHS